MKYCRDECACHAYGADSCKLTGMENSTSDRDIDSIVPTYCRKRIVFTCDSTKCKSALRKISRTIFDGLFTTTLGNV